MHPPKIPCWIVLLVMLPQLVGCLQPAGMNEFRRLEIPLSPRPETADPDRRVRVYSTDGAFVDLTSVWSDSVGISGFLVTEREDELSEPLLISIPKADVARIEENLPVKGFSAKRWAGILTIGVAMSLAMDAITADWWTFKTVK